MNTRFFRLFLPVLLAVLLIGAAVYISILSHQLKKAKGEISTISIDSAVLKEKLAKAPPAWMVKQIEKDLNPYASGISKTLLDEGFKGDKIDAFHLIRFTISQGHLSFSHDERHLYSRHFRELLACIQKLNEEAKIPDVDFIVSLQDGFDSNPGIGPCFVFAKREGENSLILVPDIKAMTGYGKLRGQIADANLQAPWKDKINRAFWRGSSTGGFLTRDGWDRLARSKLVLLSLQHPKEIDARFHSVIQCDNGVRQMLKAKGLVSGGVKKEDHLKYKYLVDVDANSSLTRDTFGYWLRIASS